VGVGRELALCGVGDASWPDPKVAKAEKQRQTRMILLTIAFIFE